MGIWKREQLSKIALIRANKTCISAGMKVSLAWIIWPGVAALAMVGIIPSLFAPKIPVRWQAPVSIPRLEVSSLSEKSDPAARDVGATIEGIESMQSVHVVAEPPAVVALSDQIEPMQSGEQSQKAEEEEEEEKRRLEDRKDELRFADQIRKSLAASQERRAAERRQKAQAAAELDARAYLERERQAVAQSQNAIREQQKEIIEQQREMLEIMRRSEPNHQLDDLERNREAAMRRNQEHWDRFTGRR